jgi:site-specific recombinase XerD
VTGFSLYQKLQESVQDKSPDEDLVFVGMQPGRGLLKDMKRANIEPVTKDGKVDFHALRVAYITFVVESGADIKSAQTLARHSTPALTLNIYARARQERLAEIADSVGNLLTPAHKTRLSPEEARQSTPTADEKESQLN